MKKKKKKHMGTTYRKALISKQSHHFSWKEEFMHFNDTNQTPYINDHSRHLLFGYCHHVAIMYIASCNFNRQYIILFIIINVLSCYFYYSNTTIFIYQNGSITVYIYFFYH